MRRLATWILGEAAVRYADDDSAEENESGVIYRVAALAFRRPA